MEDAPLRQPRFQLLDGRQVLEAHLVKGPHPFALRLQRAHRVAGRALRVDEGSLGGLGLGLGSGSGSGVGLGLGVGVGLGLGLG